MRIEVVIVCWNDRAKIKTALDSVFALKEVRDDPQFARVLVSDNGSTDGSVTFLRERYGASIEIIENRSNLGFGAACNRAFARLSSPYVYLLNPDAELRPGALAAMVAFMDEHPRCGIAGSRIFNGDGTIAESCGEFDTWAGAFLRSSGWGRWFPFRAYANGAALREWNHSGRRRVDLAIGAALCLRRATIERLGGFDERFFLYHEEVDFAKRAAGMNWETWYVPESEAVHEGAGSARGQYSVEARKQRSRRQYWRKHHGMLWYGLLVVALLLRYALYGALIWGSANAMRRTFSQR